VERKGGDLLTTRDTPCQTAGHCAQGTPHPCAPDPPPGSPRGARREEITTPQPGAGVPANTPHLSMLGGPGPVTSRRRCWESRARRPRPVDEVIQAIPSHARRAGGPKGVGEGKCWIGGGAIPLGLITSRRRPVYGMAGARSWSSRPAHRRWIRPRTHLHDQRAPCGRCTSAPPGVLTRQSCCRPNRGLR
jgi:hypothetical protein